MTEIFLRKLIMTATLPRSSGVYKILCKPTGKFYIGSTVNLRERWGRHRWSLRYGKHVNIYLQQAWDKYGEENFKFSILESVEAPNLLPAEQAWIDKTGCVNREIGFNIFNVAGSPGDMFAQVWEGFIAPKGNEVTITNLHEFCRQHELDFPSMHRLAKGKSKLKSYKGWTHRNSIRKRDYVKTYTGFIAPDGRKVEPITNLAAFCREHGLDNTHMVALIRGSICSHHGWTYQGGRSKLTTAHPKTYRRFISPSGQRLTITNLKLFCQEYSLNWRRMYEMASGKRKSHKGWTWRIDD
jgi:group I intron endonuclease